MILERVSKNMILEHVSKNWDIGLLTRWIEDVKQGFEAENLWIYGEQVTGKSAFAAFLEKELGDLAINIEYLGGDVTFTQDIGGKLLGIVDYERVNCLELIKRYSEDPFRVEEMTRPAKYIDNNLTLVNFCINPPPKEVSGWIVIKLEIIKPICMEII